MDELREFMINNVDKSLTNASNAYLLSRAKAYEDECREKLDTIVNMLATAPIMFPVTHTKSERGGRYSFTNESTMEMSHWDYKDSSASRYLIMDAERSATRASMQAFRIYIRDAKS